MTGMAFADWQIGPTTCRSGGAEIPGLPSPYKSVPKRRIVLLFTCLPCNVLLPLSCTVRAIFESLVPTNACSALYALGRLSRRIRPLAYLRQCLHAAHIRRGPYARNG